MKIDSVLEKQAFIDEFSFGIIVSKPLDATHLPFLIEKEDGKYGVLYSHFAKNNPQWKNIDNEEVLIIFNGYHSYISPTWYKTKPAVPTWNYVAVHAYGIVRIMDDSQTIEILEKTVKKFEPSLQNNKEIIPSEFRDKLSTGVICFKIEITKLEGKLKLGQQRSNEDQKGVVRGLQDQDNTDAQALAKYMLEHKIGIGK
jgi:transcriptional regulator